MGDVTIFDNLNTLIDQVVYITKNIGHSLSMIPDLIGDSIVSVSEFCYYCPPFIQFMLFFLLGTGIMKKVTHWGD